MLSLRYTLLTLVVLAVPGFGRAADTDKYLPDRTEAVVTIHVKQVLEAPLVKDRLDQFKELFAKSGGKTTLEQFGIDPFTDLANIVLSVSGNPDNEKPFVLFQGSFDNAKVLAGLDKASKGDKPAVKLTTVDGRKVYDVRADGSETYYLSVLDQGLVAICADRDVIIEAIDKKTGSRKPQLRRELEQLLGKADSKYAISIVSLPRPLNYAGLFGGLPGNVQNVQGGFVLADDVQLELNLASRDVKTAQVAVNQLNESLNQVKALLGVIVAQNKGFKPLADLLASVKTMAQGAGVELRLTINKDILEMAFKKE